MIEAFFFVKTVYCNIMYKYMVSLLQTVLTGKNRYLTDLQVSLPLSRSLSEINKLAFPVNFNHGIRNHLESISLFDRHCDNFVNHCQKIKGDYNQLFSAFLREKKKLLV